MRRNYGGLAIGSEGHGQNNALLGWQRGQLPNFRLETPKPGGIIEPAISCEPSSVRGNAKVRTVFWILKNPLLSQVHQIPDSDASVGSRGHEFCAVRMER